MQAFMDLGTRLYLCGHLYSIKHINLSYAMHPWVESRTKSFPIDFVLWTLLLLGEALWVFNESWMLCVTLGVDCCLAWIILKNLARVIY